MKGSTVSPPILANQKSWESVGSLRRGPIPALIAKEGRNDAERTFELPVVAGTVSPGMKLRKNTKAATYVAAFVFVQTRYTFGMKKQLFVFGDSITYGAIDREGGWANRLRKYLDGRMLDSGGKEFFMLYIGINDSQYVNEKGNHRVSPVDFEMNLKKLSEQAKSNGAVQIIFVGLTDVDESKTMPIPWAKEKYYDNESVRKYDDIIRAVCETNQLRFISMRGVLTNADLADGLHPNTRGAEKMFNVVKESLEPVFE